MVVVVVVIASRKDGLMVDPSIREHTVRRSPVKTPIKASQDEKKQTERKETERKSQIVLNENKRKTKFQPKIKESLTRGSNPQP